MAKSNWRSIMILYKCPCCNYNTLKEKPTGTFQICPICNWEDDDVQFNNPDYKGGANFDSLNEHKKKINELNINLIISGNELIFKINKLNKNIIIDTNTGLEIKK